MIHTKLSQIDHSDRLTLYFVFRLQWKCSKCDFRSDTTADLAVHITTDHLPAFAATGNPRKRVWTCAKCGVVFRWV